MPYAAIETRRVDLVLPVHHIGFALGVLSRTLAENNAGQSVEPSRPTRCISNSMRGLRNAGLAR